MTPKQHIRIAAVVSQVSGFGQTLLTGCARWLSEFPRSGVWVTKGEINDPKFKLAGFDGILYHGGAEGFDQRIRRFKKPAINTSANWKTVPTNSILSDDRAAVRLAIEHFHERGRSDLAVITTTGLSFHYLRREAAFVEVAKDMGVTAKVMRLTGHPTEADWARIAREIRQHAGSLGIFAADNPLGYELCSHLTRAGVTIPDEVAVVGIGNETNLCEFSFPPLSSIDNAIDQRGYRALDELVKQIAGKPPLSEPVLIPPRGVIIRHSSDLFSVHDPDVRAALRFIHDHADDAIRIESVVRAVNISRRSLEQRFTKHLGRTIHEEIWRAHVQLAKQLLIESDLPIYHVAVRSGFGTLSNFCTLFRRAEGVAPGEFRKRRREWMR